MLGQIHPRGVTMRDCLNNRGGFDRVLMAVAATFLTVSATSAMAQGGQNRPSAAELAIEAAVPVPEPANVPPPTINDFKMDNATTASITAPASASPQTPAPLTTLPTTASTAPAVPLTAPAAAPAPAAASTEPA